MVLLPDLYQSVPGLEPILNNCLDRNSTDPQISKAIELIEKALDLYDPKDFTNQKTIDHLEAALKLLKTLEKTKSEQMEAASSQKGQVDKKDENDENDKKDETGDNTQLIYLLGLVKTILAAFSFCQGGWNTSLSAIKEALAYATKLAREEKSLSNLYLQAVVKALYARILFSTEKYEQSIKIAQSALRLARSALKKCRQQEKVLAKQSKEQSEEKTSNADLMQAELANLEIIHFSLLAFIQKESLKLAEIFLDQNKWKQAVELFRQSIEMAKENNAPTVYSGLVSYFPEVKPGLAKLLEKSIPEIEIKVEPVKPKNVYYQPSGLASPLPDEIQLLRLQALLLMPDPELFDVIHVFHALYPILESFYVKAQDKKTEKSEEIENEQIIHFFNLYENFFDSDFFKELAGKESAEFVEDRIYRDDTLQTAFLNLKNVAAKGQPLSREYGTEIFLYPKERTLREQMWNWSERVSFYYSSLAFDRGEWCDINEDFENTYIYYIALINGSHYEHQIAYLQRELFKLNSYFGLYLLEGYNYQAAGFFLEEALNWIKKNTVGHDYSFEDEAEVHEGLAVVYEHLRDYKLSQKHARKARKLRRDMLGAIFFASRNPFRP